MESGNMNQMTLETLKNIIKAVRSTPGIYNYKHNDFMILDRRDQCWLKVARTVDISVEDLKNKWRILRDRYVRCQKQIMLGNISRHEVRFPFFEEMSFLDPYIKRRNINQTRNSITQQQSTETNENNPINTNQYSASETSEQSFRENNMSLTGFYEDNDDKKTQTLLSKDNSFQDDGMIEEGPIENSINDSHSDTNVYVGEETVFVESQAWNDNHVKIQQELAVDNKNIVYFDEDELFGKSIGLSLNKLSRLNNVRAKIEIYKVLEKFIEMEEGAL